MKAVNIVGQQFGRLTIVTKALNHKHGQSRWWCECRCGEHVITGAQVLRRGESLSCGCWRREQLRAANGKHGHGRTHQDTATYWSWLEMNNRCTNPHQQAWLDYGGRGISVCSRWLLFENFLADMGERPAGMTLDRRDADGHYEPSNCRWATESEQRRNQRRWMR